MNERILQFVRTTPIEKLNLYKTKLPKRLLVQLAFQDVRTIGDLVKQTDEAILRMRGIGVKYRQVIQDFLECLDG